MGGGLLQLVAYGAQDAYLSGNPQITFWKGLFKRHTNFAMEPFRINFSGQVQWGTKQTALVGRHADLLYSTYVEVVLPQNGTDNNLYSWNNEQDSLGYNLIKYVELDIGGQVVDRMYSEFMYLWGNLTSELGQAYKLQNLLSGPCRTTGSTSLIYGTQCAPDGRPSKVNVVYIPLPFFFTRNPGAALPLIALQYHEVKINVLWNDAELIAGNFRTGTSTLPSALQAAIYIDYIYLDTEERRRMAQASHEYLIEQTQYNEEKGIVGANNRIDLTFNHPVKELIWVVQPSAYRDCRIAAQTDLGQVNPVFVSDAIATTTGGGSGASFNVSYFNGVYQAVLTNGGGNGYTNLSNITVAGTSFPGGTAANNLTIQVQTVNGTAVATFTTSGLAPSNFMTRLQPFTYDIDPVFEQWLQINGQDRLDRRYGDYFSKVQSYQHHTGMFPGAFTGNSTSNMSSGGAYMYSFALRPEEHQPSGTCNFSRIDTATIVMNMAGVTQKLTSFASVTVPPGTGANPGFAKAPDYENWDVRVYAVNYNVLRVMSGMGGLAYSN